jgi:hypothetical protein
MREVLVSFHVSLQCPLELTSLPLVKRPSCVSLGAIFEEF